MTYFLLIVIAELSFLTGIWLHRRATKRWPSPALTERNALIWGAVVIGVITACTTVFDIDMSTFTIGYIGRSVNPFIPLQDKLVRSVLIGVLGCGAGILIGSRLHSRTNGIISGGLVGGFIGVTCFSIGIPHGSDYIYFPEYGLWVAAIATAIGSILGTLLTLLARKIFGRIGVPFISILPLLIIQLMFCNLTARYFDILIGWVDYIPEHTITVFTLKAYGLPTMFVMIFSLSCGLAFGIPLYQYLSRRNQSTSINITPLIFDFILPNRSLYIEMDVPGQVDPSLMAQLEQTFPEAAEKVE